MIALRSFDPDEFEHAHAAWSFFKGMTPYKDFFEHHTPWYYYLLRPFFACFSVDTSFESARHFLLFGRSLSLLLAILSVVIVTRLAQVWENRRAGALAGLLLVAQPVFLRKSLEIRPDMLALPFFLASLWLLVPGIEGKSDVKAEGNAKAEPNAKAFLRFLAAGLSLGAACMCTQKVLFVLPGALTGLGLWALAAAHWMPQPNSPASPVPAGPRPRDTIGRRAALIAVFLVGVVIPAAGTWYVFARRHAGHEFIANNFLLNAHWKHAATGQFLNLMGSSSPVLLLALAAIAFSLRPFFAPGSRPALSLGRLLNHDRYGECLLGCTMVGLFASVLVIPVAQNQYYLLPLPLVCLFAAKGLLSLFSRVPAPKRVSAFCVALLALSALPTVALAEGLTRRNDKQLARLRSVFELTQPTDMVMDGWEGTGVFRPHAFYYYFIHDENILMIPPQQVDAYVDDLESGKVRPKLIALDRHVAALGPRFLSFLKKNYSSRDGFFYFSSNEREIPKAEPH